MVGNHLQFDKYLPCVLHLSLASSFTLQYTLSAWPAKCVQWEEAIFHILFVEVMTAPSFTAGSIGSVSENSPSSSQYSNLAFIMVVMHCPFCLLHDSSWSYRFNDTLFFYFFFLIICLTASVNNKPLFTVLTMSHYLYVLGEVIRALKGMDLMSLENKIPLEADVEDSPGTVSLNYLTSQAATTKF